MKINKKSLFISFAVILSFFSCQQPDGSNQTLTAENNTVLKTANKLDNHLYEFILSRLYVLSGDTVPIYNVIIEFSTIENDTLFEVSILSRMYKDILDNIEVGCVTTDDFRLFVLDKDKTCPLYYQLDSVWSGELPYENVNSFPAIDGMVLHGKFYEKHVFSDHNIVKNHFVLYRTPTIR